MSETPNKKKPRDWHTIAGLTLVVTVVWGLSAWLICAKIPGWDHRGQFGDLFGAVNALFSGLAFAGVAYALVLQRKELEMQREELEESRRDLSTQNTLISAQLATMQEAWNFERNKAIREAKPFLIHRQGSYSNGTKECHFVNAGGPITDIEVTARGCQQYDFKPVSLLERSGRGRIVLDFSGGPDADVVIGLKYTDSLGIVRTTHYKIEAASYDWVEVAE